MSATAVSLPPPPRPPMGARPNPFAFASETTFRFAVLIAAALGTTLFVWSWVGVYWQAGDGRYAEALQTCGPLFEAPAGTVEEVAATQAAFGACMQPLYRAQTLTGLAGVVLLVLFTAVTYWYLPVWRRRRRRLVPIEDSGFAGLPQALDELRRVAGVGEPVRWFVDPLNPHTSGVAFGRRGDRCIALHRGLVARFGDDQDAFRAIVLHELAHVRNRDVDVTYLTITTWWSFAVVTIVPLAVTLVGQGWELAGHIGWRVLALMALVYLTRNAVLRARELYADVRASIWAGGQTLHRLLGNAEESAAAWRRLLKVHPPIIQRHETLDDPVPLLRIGLWEALAAGLAGTVAYSALVSALYAFIDTSADPLWAFWLSGLTYVPLAIWIVGLGIWRSVFSETVTGRRTSPDGAALGLGLGFAVGSLIGLDAAFRGSGDNLWSQDPLTGGLWGAFVVALTWLQVRWITLSARAWMGVALQRSSPRAVTMLGLTLAALLTAVWLPILLELRNFAALAETVGSTAGPFMLILGVGTLAFGIPPAIMLGMFVAVWVYPLVGAALKRAGTPQPWISLDPVDSSWLDTQSRPALTKAARVGLTGGLIVFGLLLLHRAGTHMLVPEEVRTTDNWLLQFFMSAVVIATVGQGAAAVRATTRASTLRVMHGLLAAAVTGLLAAAGILLSMGIGSCVEIFSVKPSQGCSFAVAPDFVWLTMHTVMRAGAVAALLSGLAAATVTRKSHSLRHTVGQSFNN